VGLAGVGLFDAGSDGRYAWQTSPREVSVWLPAQGMTNLCVGRLETSGPKQM
jgi:hypothetical protein